MRGERDRERSSQSVKEVGWTERERQREREGGRREIKREGGEREGGNERGGKGREREICVSL